MKAPKFTTSRLNAIGTTIVVAACLLLPPGLYAVEAYAGVDAGLTADAEILAEHVERLMLDGDGTTTASQALHETLTRRLRGMPNDHRERIDVIGKAGQLIAEAGEPPAPPIIQRGARIRRDNEQLGEIRIQRSVRPLIVNTIWLTLLGMALAAGAYLTFRLIPLRSLLRANEALRQRDASLDYANTLLTAAVEGSLDAVLVVDQTFRIVTYNRHFLDLWQVPASAAAAQNDEPLLAAVSAQMQDPEAFHARVRYLYAHPDEIGRELLYLKDGRIFDRYTQTLYGPDHKSLGRIWFFRDVTERERAADALKQSQERFKAIFDNARDGITLVDVETKRFTLVNKSMCNMLGYTLDEFCRLSLSDLHPTDSLSRIFSEFARSTRGAARTVEAIPVKRRDGSVFVADINSTPVVFDGKTYMLGLFRDVTERKEMEDAARKSEEKYRNLVESTSDSIWEIDENARYTYYSPAAVTYLGYAPGDLIGKTPFDVMAPDEAERVGKVFASIAAARAPFSLLENTVLRKDGSPVIMETSGVPIFDKVGKYCGYRGIERDITERKRSEQAREAAEAALKQRDALLHAVNVSAAEFLTAPSVDEAISRALEMVSTTLQIDRMVVLERGPPPELVPFLRYVWHAPGVTPVMDQRFFEDPRRRDAQLRDWQAPLLEGKIVFTRVDHASGALKEMLVGLGVQSTLVVPVLVDGKYWGQVGYDNCTRIREWAPFEIEILKTLSDLIGNSIQRDRYVREIANANRIVQNTPTILFRLRGEPALPMIYISQNITLLGYEAAALIKSPQFYKNLIHPDDGGKMRHVMEQALQNPASQGVVEFRLMTSRGQFRWFENRFTPIVDDAGRIVEIEGLLIDITERKAAEERIAQLARTDPLTSLANRSTFVERLRQAFLASRRGAKPFALLYIDLDRFKDINDTLGHPFGDELLTAVAERLQHAIRSTDLVARLGGDEFAVLQNDLDDVADAGALATKLRNTMAQPIRIRTNEVRITISVGISVYAPDVEKPEDLLARADVALYRAKEEGRDQYRFHTEELDAQVREEVALAEGLRMALSRNELQLYYQPQVELTNGRIVGMEALIRWNHPTRGILSPAKFIPVAERTGAITPIGQWVLESACRQMRLWRDEGIAPQTISVNISSPQFKAPAEFVRFVSDTLAKWGLQPGDLELDVTESMLARAAFAQNDVLERLHALGVKISIDDFGTKYSTLDYLRTYRVSRLKIPSALIDTATHDPDSMAMVRTIIGIARELNIEVIAQGVENQSQWSFLTTTSPVSRVQGFYYSEPVPAGTAEDLLRRGVIAPAEKDGDRVH